MASDSINIGKTAATAIGASAAATTVAAYGRTAFVGICLTCTAAVFAAPVVGALLGAKLLSKFFED
jgi:hypothetical protein